MDFDEFFLATRLLLQNKALTECEIKIFNNIESMEYHCVVVRHDNRHDMLNEPEAFVLHVPISRMRQLFAPLGISYDFFTELDASAKLVFAMRSLLQCTIRFRMTGVIEDGSSLMMVCHPYDNV
jgi:hypothetical protein